MIAGQGRLTTRLVGCVLALALLVVCASGAFATERERVKKKDKRPSRETFELEAKRLGLVSKTITLDGAERRYLVYVPKDYDGSSPAPLILFLHGRGEGGDDGIEQAKVGIYPAVQAHHGRFPCIIAMPQNAKGVWWHRSFDLIDGVVDAVRKDYNVDASRVYCTGVSLGGFGVWNYAAYRPDLFAALISCSSGGKAEEAAKVAKIPAWIFHNTGDKIVSITMGKGLVETLRAAGGAPRFTEFEDKEHDAWTRAFGDADVISWLFSQHKP